MFYISQCPYLLPVRENWKTEGLSRWGLKPPLVGSGVARRAWGDYWLLAGSKGRVFFGFCPKKGHGHFWEAWKHIHCDNVVCCKGNEQYCQAVRLHAIHSTHLPFQHRAARYFSTMNKIEIEISVSRTPPPPPPPLPMPSPAGASWKSERMFSVYNDDGCGESGSTNEKCVTGLVDLHILTVAKA